MSNHFDKLYLEQANFNSLTHSLLEKDRKILVSGQRFTHSHLKVDVVHHFRKDRLKWKLIGKMQRQTNDSGKENCQTSFITLNGYT